MAFLNVGIIDWEGNPYKEILNYIQPIMSEKGLKVNISRIPLRNFINKENYNTNITDDIDCFICNNNIFYNTIINNTSNNINLMSLPLFKTERYFFFNKQLNERPYYLVELNTMSLPNKYGIHFYLDDISSILLFFILEPMIYNSKKLDFKSVVDAVNIFREIFREEYMLANLYSQFKYYSREHINFLEECSMFIINNYDFHRLKITDDKAFAQFNYVNEDLRINRDYPNMYLNIEYLVFKANKRKNIVFFYKMLNELSEEIYKKFGAVVYDKANTMSLNCIGINTRDSPIINNFDSFSSYKLIPRLNLILKDFLLKKNNNVKVIYEYVWTSLKDFS